MYRMLVNKLSSPPLDLEAFFEEYQEQDKMKEMYKYDFIPNKAKASRKLSKKQKLSQLRIVTFNIQYVRVPSPSLFNVYAHSFHSSYYSHENQTTTEKRIRSCIAKLDPDVIVLEEVCDPEKVVSRIAYPYIIYYSCRYSFFPFHSFTY